MIILAHDGSLYGDWVARYAIRFAAAEADRKLLPVAPLSRKTAKIEKKTPAGVEAGGREYLFSAVGVSRRRLSSTPAGSAWQPP